MKLVKGWYLPDNDTDFKVYIKDGGYQVDQRNEIIKTIKDKKKTLRNCIDIGSHVGFWAKDFCKEFNHVYCFEPIEEVRECFKENVKDTNYTIYPHALGNTNGTVKLHWNENETGNTYVSDTGNREIEIKRLDDIEDMKDIDYIKMDAEGYELEILKGATQLIEQQMPFIHLEIKQKILDKQNIDQQSIENWLSSIGYVKIIKVKSEHLYAHKSYK